MVNSAKLHYWRLGGVITELSTANKIFYATRADLTLADGRLNEPCT